MYRNLKLIFAAVVVAVSLVASAATVTHKVKKGETVYGISHQYGISMEELYKYNPSARDGLKVGQVLILPDKGSDSREVKSQSKSTSETPTVNRKKTYHTIQKGETLYGIAKMYDMSLARLLALNPNVDADGYQVGTVLRLTDKTAPIVSATPAPATTITQVDESTYDVYVNNPEDSYTEAEAETGIEIDPEPAAIAEAPAAEPQPVAAEPAPIAEAPAAEPQPGPAAPEQPKTLTEIMAARLGQATNSASDAVDEDSELSIAVMLPFMLNDKGSKKAQQQAEFYRGMALAADSLAHSGRKIRIYAFDTRNSLDTVNAILALPQLAKVNVIVAPDNDAQLAAIGDFARDNGAWVLNMFAVKDTSFISNPRMIQANIPHDEMYGKAIDNFVSTFSGYTPVFLDYTVGNRDKREFAEMLQKQLTAEGIDYQTIQHSVALDIKDLKGLSREAKYVFIPLGSSRKDFAKFSSALKTFKEDFIDPDDVKLFGYPEWTIFSGDNLAMLNKLNATIYSRFYDDRSDYRNTAIYDSYKRWFNRSIGEAYPTQGLLGFDTGYFLINSLRSTGGDLRKAARYQGVQSAFGLDGDADQGLVNTGLFFINFRPSGFIDKIVIW